MTPPQARQGFVDRPRTPPCPIEGPPIPGGGASPAGGEPPPGAVIGPIDAASGGGAEGARPPSPRCGASGSASGGRLGLGGAGRAGPPAPFGAGRAAVPGSGTRKLPPSPTIVLFFGSSPGAATGESRPPHSRQKTAPSGLSVRQLGQATRAAAGAPRPPLVLSSAPGAAPTPWEWGTAAGGPGCARGEPQSRQYRTWLGFSHPQREHSTGPGDRALAAESSPEGREIPRDYAFSSHAARGSRPSLGRPLQSPCSRAFAHAPRLAEDGHGPGSGSPMDLLQEWLLSPECRARLAGLGKAQQRDPSNGCDDPLTSAVTSA